MSHGYKEAEVTHMNVNSMPEDTHEERKAAIVVLISLKQEAKNKSSEELEAQIREALEESFVRIPWVIVENVIVVEE